ncbi:MAG TPA: Gfo/Idh/MocA family oxidoreductase [Chitinophagaceae bacterium]|nr:Gfo/Idh/MocA family oxidoreductase [Chitinophagaceae bacterium]
MKKISFAIVGYGHIGQRHAQRILEHPYGELSAICELPGVEVAKDTLPEGVLWYDDLTVLLQEVSFDVLCVCTPNDCHAPHTIQALKAGRHVVCEKPMALSTEECQAMIDASGNYQRSVFVVKQNRYNEPVQQVRQLLEKGTLGRVFLIQVNCFWNRNESYYLNSAWRGKRKRDGGILFTQFSHFVDILYYLFGMVKVLHGELRAFNHPYTEIADNGCFIMETASGALVSFNASVSSYEKNMEGAITILAEKGTLKIGGQYLNTIEYQHLQEERLPDIVLGGKPNDYGAYQGSMSNHDRVIANVIDTLNGKGNIMTNAREGRDVVAIIEAMYASVQPQRK